MTTITPTPGRTFSWIIPILVGAISLLGICLILGSAWFPSQKTQPIPTRTVTPFQYQFLGTETLTPAPQLETATPAENLPDLIVTSEGDETQNAPLNEPLGIFGVEGTPTTSITPASIFAEAPPLLAGIADASDARITRDGPWINRNDVDAYQGTLLDSSIVGSYVAFSFIGQYLIIGFQSSDDGGDLLINIDGAEESVTQLEGNEWFSWELDPGTHYVILTHESGPTINLDYVEIPE